jgi:hypothetical protein
VQREALGLAGFLAAMGTLHFLAPKLVLWARRVAR